MRETVALAGAVLLAAGLAGCGTLKPLTPPAATATRPSAAPAPVPETKVERIYVPKAVKCVPEDLGPPPRYPDSDAALRDAGGAADRYQLLAAGRILREQRLAKLEEVIRRCRNASR